MKNRLLLLGILAGSLLAMPGCKKDVANDLTNEETQIYITNYDSTAAFGSYRTYAIADSVAVIRDGRQSQKEKNATDDAYTASIDKYMQARGYTKVLRSQNPDIGITLNQLIYTSTTLVSYDDYYNGYGGYWDPGYWGYGGYGYGIPYSYGVYQSTEAMLSIDMLDLKNAAAKNRISVIWTGLIRGSGIYSSSLADTQVGALFNQSAYLKSSN